MQGFFFIGGGNNNTISGANSAILGGVGNTLNEACSAILGGLGNTIAAGFPYSAVFGQNVAAVAPNTFHVECLNAVNTPPYVAAFYPVGTLQRYALPAPALGLPAGTSIVIIA